MLYGRPHCNQMCIPDSCIPVESCCATGKTSLLLSLSLSLPTASLLIPWPWTLTLIYPKQFCRTLFQSRYLKGNFLFYLIICHSSAPFQMKIACPSWFLHFRLAWSSNLPGTLLPWRPYCHHQHVSECLHSYLNFLKWYENGSGVSTNGKD